MWSSSNLCRHAVSQGAGIALAYLHPEMSSCTCGGARLRSSQERSAASHRQQLRSHELTRRLTRTLPCPKPLSAQHSCLKCICRDLPGWRRCSNKIDGRLSTSAPLGATDSITPDTGALRIADTTFGCTEKQGQQRILQNTC